ncbi:MAG TPA: hypothetical protein DGO89_21600 [Microcoleaceae bacterium UBA9251]|jgi:hypothetical protein|nr:hypothetical protein [Microcoleaceae cyanobacterium UBA9251]
MKYFVATDRFSKKPGFFSWRVARNRVFLRNTWLSPADSVKNPVSLVGGWPETGFLSKNPPSKPTGSVKNPVSLVGGWLFRGATAYHN